MNKNVRKSLKDLINEYQDNDVISSIEQDYKAQRRETIPVDKIRFNPFSSHQFFSDKRLKDRIYKGYQRAIQQKIVSTFLQSLSPVTYPANTTIYRPQGTEIRQIKSPISLQLQLGTDTGNATFKKWVEEQIIPDLKRGFIGTDQIFENLRTNPFITDLSASIVTNTPLRNPTFSTY